MCGKVLDKLILRNTGGATSTGTAQAFIRGISPLLHLSISLAFLADTKARPASFTGNTFDLIGYVRTSSGESVQLSDTPINNNDSGDQQAPDGWEGVTGLDEIRMDFAYTGLSGVAGSWYVILRAEPAVPMADEALAQLLARISVSVPTPKSV